MTVKILSDKAKKDIHDKLINGKATKTELAKSYGVHRRTIDRVLWEMSGEEDKSLRSGACKRKAGPVIDYSKTNVICTPQQVLITLSDGSQHTAFRDKEHFTRIFTLAMEEKYEEMMKYVDISNAVREFTFGTDIKVVNGVMLYKGREVHSSIAKRIVEASQDASQDINRYVNFFRKLHDNPSAKAVQHTYDFLVHNDLEISDEGDVLAYKYISYINGQPVDTHTGKVPNWKGWTVKMARNLVEDDPHKTCSRGLHVGSLHYVGSFTDVDGQEKEPQVIKVSFSPADVVSVPVDYNNSKMRVCKYRVLTGKPHESYNGENSAEVEVDGAGDFVALNI